MQQAQLKQLARRVTARAHLAPDLERRIRTMARRWRYTETELLEVLALAADDPPRWLLAVNLDERKFGGGEEWPLH